jgi:hypothetical protein
MPFLLRAYFFMPILYNEVAHMERPVTEGINKAFVHIPTGEVYTGYDVEDILWAINRMRELGICKKDTYPYIAEEFTEVYV